MYAVRIVLPHTKLQHDGIQIIIDYVNQQPIIPERLHAFLIGYIQDF